MSAERVPGLVSGVIPVHARPLLLVEAVESVRAQTYPNWEIVVVDDASRDETPEVAARLAREEPERIRAIRLDANAGPGAAREAGRRAARGELEQYLDSDDLLRPRKLEAQVAALAGAPAAPLAYGPTLERHLDGRVDPRPIRRTGERIGTLFPALLAGRLWITTTPLYRAAALAAAGGWSDLRRYEDWELEARIAALGGPLAWVDEPVAELRHHSGPHACDLDAADLVAHSERARALALVHAHAARAGVSRDAPEMRRFSRGLFLEARQLGRLGLTRESARLFALARSAATDREARGADFRFYRLLAAVVGWRKAAMIALRFEGRRDPP